MTKIFSNQIKRSKDKTKASSTNLEDKANEKSKPMIIIGLIVSLSSIFLLLFTIKNKFG
ncbi:hypothetical protein [Prochlorococcus marinus]|uniref:hypothetical protein n=1 Tax=Prochlorococcus marinus TaxID=1219 RepID=UPI0002F7D380|nr:hypothetical protein [Prochlorococcus marinus]